MRKENTYTIFTVRFDVLGQKYHTNMLPTFHFIFAYISNNPENSGAIVIAPNTGKDDDYNEKAIGATIQEVDNALQEYIYICYFPGTPRITFFG
jgi:hypothetical protein